MIRAILKRDIERIKELHSKFFDKEFPIEYLLGYGQGVVATDDNDRAIVIASTKSIIEAVMVQDKEYNLRQRRKAAMELFDTIKVTTRLAGYNELHCFIQDDNWMKHLIRYGFKPTKGKSLVVNL